MGNTHVLNFLAFIFVTCSVDQLLCVIHGERGSSITLNPYTRGELQKVTWTRNGQKVVEYNLERVETFDPFKRRVILGLHSGELTIKRLKIEDGGVYESTVLINGKSQYSKHELQVIDTVPQPKVTCQQADPESEATLLCSVDLDTPVQYRWIGATVYDHPGSELRFGKQEDLDSVYTCIVKNEVSENHATFTLRDCQPGGVSPGIIAAIILSVIGALCLLILIPFLVYRRKKKKLLKKYQGHGRVDIENGENRNLLSPGETTDKNTEEGGKEERSRGLFRAVHLKQKSGSGLEDTDNEDDTPFSLRATLPSHAKLRPPRTRDQQTNGTCKSKDLNSPDKSTANGLQQEDQSAEKFKPVLLEGATLDQKAVEAQAELHDTESALAVITDLASNAEDPDIQLVAVNHSKGQPVDEELPQSNQEGVPKEIQPYLSHNITAMTKGEDRIESYEEEENVIDKEKDTDLTPVSGVDEENDGNGRPQTDTENSQEEESLKQEEAGEDIGLHQENHEIGAEESSMDKERNDERVHLDRAEEEASDAELKEESPLDAPEQPVLPQEDALNDEKKNEQMGEVQEKEKASEEEEEEENILIREQPLGENEQSSSILEPQEMEHEVRQGQTVDEGEQEPHANKGLVEERRTGENDVEGGEMDPETESHVREGESESEQGDGEEVNTDQREEEEGAEMTSQSGVEEEKHVNETQQTYTDSSQDEESVKQEKVGEDTGPHLKDHVMVVKESSVDMETEEEKDSDGEQKEECPEVEHVAQENLKEDAPKEGKKSEQGNQDEAEMDPEMERRGNERDEREVQETDRTDEVEEEEKDLTTREQPLGENKQGSSIPEPKEMEHEVRDEGDQEPHVNEGLDEGRRTEEHDVEGVETEPETECHGATEQESERKQGDGVAVNTDQGEEEEGQDGEMAGQQQNELKQEDIQEPDEETVSVNCELEDEPLKQTSDVSLEEQHIDCQDVNVLDEINGEESEMKLKSEDTKSNTPVEEKKQEEQEPLKEADNESIPEEHVALKDQDSCLPEGQRTDKVISDHDETQDNYEQDEKTETMSKHDQTKDLLENEFKQEQTEQQNNKSPLCHEDEGGKPERKDDKENTVMTEIKPDNGSSQEQEKGSSELPNTGSDGEGDRETSSQLQNEEHLEHKDEERGQFDNTESQDQPLQEQQHVGINLDDGQENKNISDSGEEEENECDAQKGDLDSAKEESEGNAQIKDDTKLEEEGEISDANQVQEEADPAVSDGKVIAVHEKEHDGAEDQMNENVGNLCKNEKLHPAEEKDVEQRQEKTQKAGEQDDANSASDENENTEDEKDDEMMPEPETDKDTAAEVNQRQTDEEQLHTEVSGQLQNEQNRAENNDEEERMSAGEEPPKDKTLESEGEQMEHQPEQPRSKNDTRENEKDGMCVVSP